MLLDRRTFMGVVGASAGLQFPVITRSAQGEVQQIAHPQDPANDDPFHFSPSDRYDQ